MTAVRKRSHAQTPNDTAQPATRVPLGLAGWDSAPGINVVAEHSDRLEAAFVAQHPAARHSGAVRIAVIFGGSGLLWGGIALLIRSVLGH